MRQSQGVLIVTLVTVACSRTESAPSWQELKELVRSEEATLREINRLVHNGVPQDDTRLLALCRKVGAQYCHDGESWRHKEWVFYRLASRFSASGGITTDMVWVPPTEKKKAIAREGDSRRTWEHLDGSWWILTTR